MTEVRRIVPDELAAWFRNIERVFFDPTDVDGVAATARGFYDLDRVWAAFDDPGIVATLRTVGTHVTVPGRAQVPATCVAAVTVLPTHRRRGILTRMMAAEHAAARERGETVALLYASEYGIYGRFGYGAAASSATWTVDARSARVRGQPSGSVELANPAAARDDVGAVYAAHQARQVGEIGRKDYRLDFELGLRRWPGQPPWKGEVALHRSASGAVDGYARYTGKEVWERGQPRFPLELDDLVALTDAAYVDLWRFVLGIDLVATVKAERRRLVEPLPWILENARDAQITDAGEGPFVCLLDVPRALAARTYEREGSLVLEVAGGPWGPDRRERVRLAGGPDGTTCTATDASPDLTLPAWVLGAAYLGGGPLRSIAIAGGVDEHVPGALDRADAMFGTRDRPWCSTFF